MYFLLFIILTSKGDNPLSLEVSHLAKNCLHNIVSDQKFTDCANRAKIKWNIPEEYSNETSVDECCLAYDVIDCKFDLAKVVCTKTEYEELMAFKDEITKGKADENQCNFYESRHEKCKSVMNANESSHISLIKVNPMNVITIIVIKYLI